ncbi:hypothetical protein BDQ12DRAFT_671156 [Crucibulum laeve]|uniref:Ubiquitin-like domain-containing protein n=1 Tax=Crucibulum laeve TaxID=68775 RepID=A0A5C3LUA1_9AGAR|nr:hypothetical protein BDQ12DRAFT_671156 [Crucibulum laeve]
MAEQAEQAFAKTFLNTLSTQPITYADDYQQPAQNSLKRVPVLQTARGIVIFIRHVLAKAMASISLVFKSLKPPASYTISVQPTDTIAAIKSQLAAQAGAPPVDAQRLLLKGKALADAKLLKEYSVQDGVTVNLMIKPGFEWDPSKAAAMTSPSSHSPASAQQPSPSPASLEKPTRKHQRIPSLVLSPSPSETPGVVEKDITLTLDTSSMPSPSIQAETLSTYHATVSNPEFWERLYAFVKSEFTTDTDAHQAFEDFLCATKGSLTPHEIAKIRDHVGVIGMSGKIYTFRSES